MRLLGRACEVHLDKTHWSSAALWDGVSLQVRGQSLTWERGQVFVGSAIEPGAHSGCAVGHRKNKAQAVFQSGSSCYAAVVSLVAARGRVHSKCFFHCYIAEWMLLAEPVISGVLENMDPVFLQSLFAASTSRVSPMTTISTECQHAGTLLGGDGIKPCGAKPRMEVPIHHDLTRGDGKLYVRVARRQNRNSLLTAMLFGYSSCRTGARGENVKQLFFFLDVMVFRCPDKRFWCSCLSSFCRLHEWLFLSFV